jgi:hypothetical protein
MAIALELSRAVAMVCSLCVWEQVLFTPGLSQADTVALLAGANAPGGAHLGQLLKFVVARTGEHCGWAGKHATTAVGHPLASRASTSRWQQGIILMEAAHPVTRTKRCSQHVVRGGACRL